MSKRRLASRCSRNMRGRDLIYDPEPCQVPLSSIKDSIAVMRNAGKAVFSSEVGALDVNGT